MGTVCVIGSLNIDLVTKVESHPRPGETVRGAGLVRLPGGKGANQALAAARAGARTLMCGRIGSDGTGLAYRNGLSERGVDCTGVLVAPDTPSGHALIAVDAKGENTIIVIPGANAALTDVDRHAAAIVAADVLLLQLEIPMSSVLRAAELARDNGVRVILNPSPWTMTPSELLDVADPVVVNEHEAGQLAGSTASVCVTLGERGARWGDVSMKAPMANIIDTTGAGDAFAGALAAALANGSNREEALRRAVAAGAEACSWMGAQGWQL
jgi:ribokinase